MQQLMDLGLVSNRRATRAIFNQTHNPRSPISGPLQQIPPQSAGSNPSSPTLDLSISWACGTKACAPAVLCSTHS